MRIVLLFTKDIQEFSPDDTVKDIIEIIETDYVFGGQLISKNYFISKNDMNLKIGDFKDLLYLSGENKPQQLPGCKNLIILFLFSLI